MKNLSILILITLFLTSCKQEETKVVKISNDSDIQVSKMTKQLEEKPFSNPVFMYGSSFGNLFQMMYKTGSFNDMIKFTSSGSVNKFGKNKILEFYKNMDFAYKIKLKSQNINGDTTILNYECGIMATTKMLRIPAVIENDTVKIVLSDLKGLR